MFFSNAREVIDHRHVRFPAGLGCFFGVGVKIIDRRYAIEHVKTQRFIIPEMFHNLYQAVGGYLDPWIQSL